jgi:hypothetical protein
MWRSQWVVATLRRKSQVHEFQSLRIIRAPKSKETASCLGKSELQPQRIGPLEPIANQTIGLVLHLPSELAVSHGQIEEG